MYVCMYVCKYICVYVCMYVSMYVCTYVCMFNSVLKQLTVLSLAFIRLTSTPSVYAPNTAPCQLYTTHSFTVSTCMLRNSVPDSSSTSICTNVCVCMYTIYCPVS